MRQLNVLIATAGLAMASFSASASDFPNRNVDIVVPFGAGGSTDLMTRALSEEMKKHLGVSVGVVNKAGGAGTIGTAEVASARADGYTLGMSPVGPLTTQTNLRNLPYSPESFDYVCLVYSNPQILIVSTDSEFNSVRDVIAAAKDGSRRLRYGSTGAGSIPHLAGVALATSSGVDMVHVPHSGDADQLSSVLGGHIDMLVSHPAFLTANRDSVKGLGIMAPERISQFPDLRTFAEQGGPDLDIRVWGGLTVPAGTPQDVIAKLESACEASVKSASFREQLARLNTPEAYMGHREFARFVMGEYENNRTLLREAGVLKD
ncbi:MAG: tripartite tricarboxylate transporter substrate binding protein [Aquisalimonadaceae bacterium]